jgi:hypothetical protein
MVSVGHTGTVISSGSFEPGKTYTWDGTAWSSFGTVAPTGIPGIRGYTLAMILFLLISAALWGYILRRRLIRNR